MKEKKSEAEKGREQRVKYATMARDLGYLSKKESDDFTDDRKVEGWESDYHSHRESKEGKVLEKERGKVGAAVQSKMSRMVKERGFLDTEDYKEFEDELNTGRVSDNRGKTTGKKTFFFSKNPLARPKQ